jgi:hypothetical protein
MFAGAAFANAPNPNTTTIDQVVINPDGSTTVTVQGTWTWASQTNCPAARNGVGYQVDWFDNTANAIGTNKSPNGILYVGDAQDNIVHSIETLGGSSTIGNAFWDGVPSSYTPGTNPTATDAKNWFSRCDQVNSSGVTAGSWGPITHTYAATATQPLKLCPILYDPHGGHQDSGQSSVKDITAGANTGTKSYNDDNSYQTNGTGPNGNTCPVTLLPSLTTSASSATAPGSIHDTATLSNTGGQSGSITFNLYPAGANCTGTPLYTNSVSTNGDGDYTSGDYGPTSAGTYQWQASYSSSTVNGLITPCNDPNERSHVGPPSQPKSAGMTILKLASVRCADLSPHTAQPSKATPCTGVWSNYLSRADGTMTVQVPHSGKFAIPINYEIQVTNTGQVPLTLSLSDSRCDPGTISGPFAGPGGGLTGSVLAAGGQAYFTCSHTLTLGDDPSRHGPFTNVATVTGAPPSGPPVSRRSRVTVKTNHPSPITRFCKSLRTGRKVRWPLHTRKPRACRPQRPHGNHGFTG